jgi:anti-anti-sigma factor
MSLVPRGWDAENGLPKYFPVLRSPCADGVARDEMQATVLVRIIPAGPASRPSVRAFLRTAARIREQRGFQRWQTFRAMDATGALLVLVDWDCADSLALAMGDGELQHVLAAAPGWGMQITAVEVLDPSFDRRLAGVETVATLLRLTGSGEPAVDAASRDCDLALQALAAPGSTRLYGARRSDGQTAVCRIDFDTEDGIWHFLESPLRKMWSAHAGQQREMETWALNLPRLEYRHLRAEEAAAAPRRARQESLSVQLSFQNDTGCAQVRLEGRVDSHGSALSEKFFQALISDGCQRLEVDVSGLTGISAEAVRMLTRAARSLKARGGHFVLVDNEERVRRVTRTRHLETSLR